VDVESTFGFAMGTCAKESGVGVGVAMGELHASRKDERRKRKALRDA